MENDVVNNFAQIYYYIAIFATILFAIKLAIFTLFGGDTEVSGDFNTEFDTDTSFDFLSVQTLLAFLMGFGWMGYAALQQFGLSQLAALFSAIGVGLVFLFGTAYLMFLVRKLEKNVKKDKTTALNKTGKAYTKFEPKGQGQIEIEVNGQLTIANAINTQDFEINAFEMIKVIKVENDLMYIEKEN